MIDRCLVCLIAQPVLFSRIVPYPLAIAPSWTRVRLTPWSSLGITEKKSRLACIILFQAIPCPRKDGHGRVSTAGKSTISYSDTMITIEAQRRLRFSA